METGLVGLALYLILIGGLLVYLGREIWGMRETLNRQFAMAFYCGFAGVAVGSYTNGLLTQIPTGILVPITLVLPTTWCFGTSRRTQKRGRPEWSDLLINPRTKMILTAPLGKQPESIGVGFLDGIFYLKPPPYCDPLIVDTIVYFSVKPTTSLKVNPVIVYNARVTRRRSDDGSFGVFTVTT